MSIEDFYKSIKKNAKANTELNQLYKQPVPEKGIYMPVAQVFQPDIYYQADTLYMPEDKKFKYILVVVDMHDGRIDAEPMKDVNKFEVLKAFKKIYSRDILYYPIFITFDKGNEFKNPEVEKYFNQNGTNVKYALTGRSRQLANVERANQKISSILFKRMANQELITGEQNNEWVDDLPELVKVLNKNLKKPLQREIFPEPVVDEYTGKLLPIGTKVRLLLDYPINNTNHARLSGKFRTSDIRWTPDIYEITDVILKPGYPPGYLTNKNDMVFRTKNQLAVVKKNEKEPDSKFIRGNPKNYIISEILDKKIENNKTFYLVRWKGFKKEDATWEHAKTLDRTDALRKLKRDFNDEND